VPLSVSVLEHQVPVIVVGHDEGVVVKGRFDDEPANSFTALVRDYELVLDIARRRVGELVALLEQVEDLGVGGRAVIVGSAAAEAGQYGADLGVTALHQEVDHQLDATAGERRTASATLLAMPYISKKLVETRLSIVQPLRPLNQLNSLRDLERPQIKLHLPSGHVASVEDDEAEERAGVCGRFCRSLVKAGGRA